MTEGCSRLERKTKLTIEEACVVVSLGQFELLRVRWIEVRTVIKPHTVTSTILSSSACDPFGEDRWCTGSTYELDRPCPHSSAAYSRSVPIRRGTEVKK